MSIERTLKRSAAMAVFCAMLLSACGAAFAEQPVMAPAAASAASADVALSGENGEFRSLDEEVQSLKEEVLDLNRDLFLLEEELLFPANSQVAFFISMDVGEYFALDSVNLKIDGKEVTNYLYTERELGALLRRLLGQALAGVPLLRAAPERKVALVKRHPRLRLGRDLGIDAGDGLRH